MKWINFLHLYQPVNTNSHYIKEATDRAYRRILRGLEEHPNIKFTLNISGCLLLRWEDLGYERLFVKIKKLVDKGQIELVGTAAYHPILPLVSPSEIIKQVKENEEIIKKYINPKIKLRGFFLPEMAYSPEISKILIKLGYQWLILDDFAAGKEKIDNNISYIDQAGMKIVFRSRKFSNCYIPDVLPKLIEKKKNENLTIITATDAEIYGLRHEDPTAEFEKLLKRSDYSTETISDYLNDLTQKKKIKIRNSSWETTEKDLKDKLPYAVWHDPKNKIQKLLWQFAGLASKIESNHAKDKNHYWSRWHLVRGLSSCTFWWASGKDFKHVFGPVAWNPDEIDKGLNELIRSIRSLDSLSASEKIKAEKLDLKIKELVWTTHWRKYNKK